MRTWLSWAWPAASLAAIVAACGGGNGTTGGFTPDGGENGDGASSSSGASSGSSGASSGSSGASSSSSGGSTSSSGVGSSSGPSDATLDIAFPDVFTMPDSSSGSGGGTSSGSGGDGSMGCAPVGITCNGTIAEDCAVVDGGTKLTSTDCSQLSPAQQCANGFGCVTCVPGTGTCNGSVGTACNSTGTGTVTNNCDSQLGETCNPSSGQCEGDCANVGQSYIGCEYYAVTMLNHLLDQNTFYFSVSLSNASTKTATVTISGGALATPTTVMIPAGQLQEVKLPWVKALSCGAGNTSGTCNGNSLDQPTAPGTTYTANGAYHIKSTEPITAYEFNARDYVIGTEYSYTNDASLLIPVNAMTANYHVASWPTFYVWPGLMTVVATQPNTTVQVTATNPIQTYGGLGANGGTVTLANAGDVLEIMTALNSGGGQAYGTDPSGTAIVSTNGSPIEVFGGHSCVYINATTGYCDHVEQIAFPDETLRGDYLVTVPHNQNGTPQHWVKIVGTTANTNITFDGITQANTTLNAGTVLLLQTVTSDFRVHSTDVPEKPFFVAQYMVGQNNFGTNCVDVQPPAGQNCGDPSMSLAVATAQFRNSYQFSAPQSYYENWVNVIAPNGTTVTVTDTPSNHTVSSGTAIGTSGYYEAHVNICANQTTGCNPVHQASSSSGTFGIEVYGYGAYTSYMYPGGLNLNRQ